MLSPHAGRLFCRIALGGALWMYSGGGGCPAGEDKPPASPATDTPQASPVDESRRIAGRTLADWRAWFQEIELSSAEAGREVPALMQLVEDRSVPPVTRRQAALTLGRLGDRAAVAVPLLTSLLEEPGSSDEVDPPRLWGLKAVALMGRRARDATDAVRNILKSPQASLLERLMALEALGRIGAADDRTLPAIVEWLQSPAALTAAADVPLTDAEQRELQVAAAEILSLFGASAAPAMPALLTAARDPHEPLRRAAVTTLGTIGSPVLVDSLVDVLQFDSSPAVQDAAAVSLSQIGAPAVQTLTGLLDDSEADIRMRAADGLRRIGPPAQPAVAKLRKLMDDESAQVCLAAAEAVFSITDEFEAALDRAAPLLGSPDRQVRMRAHQLLIALGRAGHSGAVAQQLEPLVNGRNPVARQTALLTLRELQQLR